MLSIFKARIVLINSQVVLNFNCCLSVWMLSVAKALNKVEGLHKRTFGYLFNNYISPYDIVYSKRGKFTTKLKRLSNLCIEIYKTPDKIYPAFLNEIFKLDNSNMLFQEKLQD